MKRIVFATFIFLFSIEAFAAQTTSSKKILQITTKPYSNMFHVYLDGGVDVNPAACINIDRAVGSLGLQNPGYDSLFQIAMEAFRSG